jgi:2-dehydropantoate 2-reductase
MTDKIVIFGAGAIGCTMAAWLNSYSDNVYLLAKDKNYEVLKREGCQLYALGKTPETIKLNHVIQDLNEVTDAKIIIVTVKNWALEETCKSIKEIYGDSIFIVGLQNGIINQQIYPKYFSKVIYSIGGYNCWRDRYGLIGYERKGDIYLGLKDSNPELQKVMEDLYHLFGKAFGTVLIPTGKLRNAVHCKIIINLSNSITTLIGLNPHTKDRNISSKKHLKWIITMCMNEAIAILKKNGFQEYKFSNMPGWDLIRMVRRLPAFLSQIIFNGNVKKMQLSSMAQDVVIFQNEENELETINGVILKLAKKSKTPASYNQALYRLCKEAFAKKPFIPMDVKEVWARMESENGRGDYDFRP